MRRHVRPGISALMGACLLVAGLSAGAAQTVPSGLADEPVAASPMDAPVPAGGRPVARMGESYREMTARQAAFAAAHTGSLRTNLGDARLHAFGQARRMPAALDAALSRSWREAGPKPFHADDDYEVKPLGWDRVSGRVQVIAPDPTDPTGNKVWIGTSGGGAWYTRDGGKTWAPKFDRMPSLAVGAIALDPANPNRIFLGTGDAHSCGGCYPGVGLYRSTDNGTTWKRVSSLKKDAAVSRIEIAGGRIFASTNRGLFRSTDGGNSFHDVGLPTNASGDAPDSGVFGNYVTDVRVKPGSPDVIVAAVGWRAGRKNAPGNGLYRSTQGGAPGTWSRMTATGFGMPGRSSDPIGRITFTFAPQDPSVMWALIQDAGLFSTETFIGLPLPAKSNILNGVYRSGDGGESWELKATSESFQAAPGSALLVGGVVLYAPGVQSWYNQWIAVDPNDLERVLVGLEEIYQTTSNANGAGLSTWTTIGRYWNACHFLNGPPPCDETIGGPYAGMTTHPDQHAGVMIKTGSGTLLYAGNDGGMYRQVAGPSGFDNLSWTSLNDTLGTSLPYYAVMGRDGTIYAGFQDNGTAKITPDGRGSMVFGGDGFDVAVHPNNSNIAYEEYVGGTMSVTTDGGRTWRSIDPGLSSALFSTPFEMDPLNPDHLVIGGRQIKETDRGPNVCVETSVAGEAVLSSCNWATAFDLGYNEKVFECDVDGTEPVAGECPEDLRTNAPYQMSAVDVIGPRVYVAFCGVCDVITQGSKSGNAGEFENGIATNVKDGCVPLTAQPAPLLRNDTLPPVGADEPVGDVVGPSAPASCWHKILRPKGLPNRYVTDIEMDPADPKTLYVTVAGYGRKWLTPDERTPGVGTGNVFVSRDGGATFSNISANLPAAPANAALLAGDRLFVGTDVGVFSAPKSGGSWTRVGAELPDAYVVDLNLNPQGTTIVAATFGRGVWTYDLSAGSAPAPKKPRVLGKTVRRPLPATGVDPATGVGVALLVSAALIRRRVRSAR